MKIDNNFIEYYIESYDENKAYKAGTLVVYQGKLSITRQGELPQAVVYSVEEALDTKVDKEDGKRLMTNLEGQKINWLGQVFTDGRVFYENNRIRINFDKSNIVNQTNSTQDIFIQPVSSETAGVITPEQFNSLANKEGVAISLQALALEIESALGKGGSVGFADFGDTPTQEALTQHAMKFIWKDGGVFTWDGTNPANSTYVNNDTTHYASEIFNGTEVKNTKNNHRWKLANTDDTEPPVYKWIDTGDDSVIPATNELFGIVKGSDEISIIDGIPTINDEAVTLEKLAPSTVENFNTKQEFEEYKRLTKDGTGFLGDIDYINQNNCTLEFYQQNEPIYETIGQATLTADFHYAEVEPFSLDDTSIFEEYLPYNYYPNVMHAQIGDGDRVYANVYKNQEQIVVQVPFSTDLPSGTVITFTMARKGYHDRVILKGVNGNPITVYYHGNKITLPNELSWYPQRDDEFLAQTEAIVDGVYGLRSKIAGYGYLVLLPDGSNEATLKYVKFPDNLDHVIVAWFYYNSIIGISQTLGISYHNVNRWVHMGEERHSASRDTNAHLQMHNDTGMTWERMNRIYTKPKVVTGDNDAIAILAPNNMLGVADEDLRFRIVHTDTHDENSDDFTQEFATKLKAHIYFRIRDYHTDYKTVWVKSDTIADDFMFGDVDVDYDTGEVTPSDYKNFYYNEIDGDEINIRGVTDSGIDGDYVYYTSYIAFTTDKREPVKIFAGTKRSQIVQECEYETFDDLQYPTPEVVFAYKIIFKLTQTYESEERIVNNKIYSITQDKKFTPETQKTEGKYTYYQHGWELSGGDTEWIPFGGFLEGDEELEIKFSRANQNTNFINFAIRSHNYDTYTAVIHLVNHYNSGASGTAFSGTGGITIGNVETNPSDLTPINHLGYGGFSIGSKIRIWDYIKNMMWEVDINCVEPTNGYMALDIAARRVR
ncbi:MAG: hypothetical protein LBF71_02625 [Campylobacteraceae bacterium]|jgi:hypothetical protein|nr:hypothetical protein [Campylobacteraceae bacterium]